MTTLEIVLGLALGAALIALAGQVARANAAEEREETVSNELGILQTCHKNTCRELARVQRRLRAAREELDDLPFRDEKGTLRKRPADWLKQQYETDRLTVALGTGE